MPKGSKGLRSSIVLLRIQPPLVERRQWSLTAARGAFGTNSAVELVFNLQHSIVQLWMLLVFSGRIAV